MSLAQHITALVLTYNEEANIGRTLAALHWVPRILVVDSGSTDGTLAIVERFPQTKVVIRSFDSFAAQCNFGLTQIASPWVLSLDADYVVSDALAREVLTLTPDPGTCGFRASFIYRLHGRSLRATLYPPRTVLYRRDRATYRDIGHGHRVEIAGPVRELAAPIYHDDRKPLSRWLATQRSYARR
ncbi:MAG TPA: glycosyltransferase family 2 protein, partial [Hyphomicrobiaceae bacterium]|nr:glycosyltransferase family 2 protein [Hyphomicrobiaceae bacterium]